MPSCYSGTWKRQEWKQDTHIDARNTWSCALGLKVQLRFIYLAVRDYRTTPSLPAHAARMISDVGHKRKQVLDLRTTDCHCNWPPRFHPRRQTSTNRSLICRWNLCVGGAVTSTEWPSETRSKTCLFRQGNHEEEEFLSKSEAEKVE